MQPSSIDALGGRRARRGGGPCQLSEEEAGREAKIREKIPMILFPFFSIFFFFTPFAQGVGAMCVGLAGEVEGRESRFKSQDLRVKSRESRVKSQESRVES